MNSVNTSRHTAKQRAAHRKKAAPSQHEKKTAENAASRLFTFTIDADTAQIVKLELLDASGTRREPSDREKAALMSEGRARALENVLARAFEAGLACALGEKAAREETESLEESAEDAQLHELLLTWLIEHSDMRDLLKPDALGRAILDTLIQHSIQQPPAPTARSTRAHPGRTAQARTNRQQVN